MPTSFVLLQWLLYMNPAIGLNYSYTTPNCFVFDSTTTVKTGNRVCHSAIPTDKEIEQIKSFFGDRRFTWAADVTDMKSIELLEKNGLHYRVALSAMKMHLDALCTTDYDPAIRVIEILPDTDDVALWAAIVSPAFTLPAASLMELVRVLNQHLNPPHLKLYVGYYHQAAAAAGMAIEHGECISLHWIATVSEFRNRGLGRAVTHKALVNAQARDCKQAILLSSDAGKHMYEKLGFEEYGVYAIYGNY